MSTLPKEVSREMIKDSNLKTIRDLHTFLNHMFKDALQEMLEAELDTEFLLHITPLYFYNTGMYNKKIPLL